MSTDKAKTDTPEAGCATGMLGARFDAWLALAADAVDMHGTTEDRMRAAWNAAIDEAADRCEAMCHYYQVRRRYASADEAADACKDEVRKLRSEPNVRANHDQHGAEEPQ